MINIKICEINDIIMSLCIPEISQLSPPTFISNNQDDFEQNELNHAAKILIDLHDNKNYHIQQWIKTLPLRIDITLASIHNQGISSMRQTSEGPDYDSQIFTLTQEFCRLMRSSNHMLKTIRRDIACTTAYQIMTRHATTEQQSIHTTYDNIVIDTKAHVVNMIFRLELYTYEHLRTVLSVQVRAWDLMRQMNAFIDTL